MKKIIKSILRSVISKYSKPDPQKILNDLSRGGAKIGKKVAIFNTDGVFIDNTRPWLLSIGDYTKITKGVVILTHDYSLSTIRRTFGEYIGEGAKTVIGNNVFIGMNSIVLMGSSIGNNVIVGAGSVVHGSFPDNVVIAGNPAKIICTLEEHYLKRKSKTVNEAIECAKTFYERFGTMPKPKDLKAFFPLFAKREKGYLESVGINLNPVGDEKEELMECFFNSKPYWNDFEELLKAANLIDNEKQE